MAGDEGGLEHDVSSCASSSSDNAFAALRAAVMCHWCEAGEGRSVLTFDLSRFGHLSDKHGAGDGADTANGPQDFRGPGKSIVWADGLRDLRFQFCNLPSQKALQLVVHNSESISVSRFLMRFDLSEASFARLYKLPALRHQGSEMAYLFMWQGAPRLWPESHEARNKFRVDLVRFGPCSSAGSESLDCRHGSHRAGLDA